jgi:hypothetical protein
MASSDYFSGLMSDALNLGSNRKASRKIRATVAKDTKRVGGLTAPWTEAGLPLFQQAAASATASGKDIQTDPLLRMIGSKGMNTIMSTLGASGLNLRDRMKQGYASRLAPAMMKARMAILEPHFGMSSMGAGVGVAGMQSQAGIYAAGITAMMKNAKSARGSIGGMF